MATIFKKSKKIFKDMDRTLLILSIILFIGGLLNIVTASSRESTIRYNQGLYHYFYYQLIFLIVGCILGSIILKIDTKKYKYFVPIIFVIILLLNIACLFTSAIKGSRNWLPTGLGGFRIQPSEFAKPILIVMLAIIFEKLYRKLRTKDISHVKMIVFILMVGLSVPAIVFLQKDFGTMLIITFIFIILFLASPILKREKFNISVLVIIIIGLAALGTMATGGKIFTKAQSARFNYINPCSKYESGGYQICNAYIAINSGGLFGVGLGKSKQKYSYIPEPHTDSVFAIVAEENGIFIIGIIFILYGLILNKILSIASNASTLRGRYICLGIASYIFLHIFINLGGLFGLIPLTGVPLPFLSYGGSFTISLVVALAIVQRVNIETKNKKIKV